MNDSGRRFGRTFFQRLAGGEKVRTFAASIVDWHALFDMMKTYHTPHGKARATTNQ